MAMRAKALAALGCLALLTGAAELDPDNPTCPLTPDWGSSEPMSFRTIEGERFNVLVAEGRIDADLPERLQAAFDADPMIGEVWLRSRGGNARAGNDAGRILREYNMLTRIPLELTVIRDRNQLYVQTDEGAIDNIYTLSLVNMDENMHEFDISISGIESAQVIGKTFHTLDGGEVRTLTLRVRIDPSLQDIEMIERG